MGQNTDDLQAAGRKVRPVLGRTAHCMLCEVVVAFSLGLA